MSTALEKEYKFFIAHREEFSKTHLHQFVLIKGEEVINFFPSYEPSLRAGLLRFGNVPFFVQEVKEADTSPNTK